MLIGRGDAGRTLGEGEVRQILEEAVASLAPLPRSVLVIIPDGTRTMPMPMMFGLLEETLGRRVETLDYLVALGTHRPMSDEQLGRLVGRPVDDGRCGRSRIFNHDWSDPATFVSLGLIPAAEVGSLTGGRLAVDLPVKLNRRILDYELVLICGPVFPHEVVGFSGGNKYFFPGIGGAEVINLTHWLGALITSYDVIGAGYTPVRAVIDRAARLVDRPKRCLALVVTQRGLAGAFFGSPEDAWQAASEVSAKVHIVWVEKPYRRVLSVMPTMYDDLWTAAKGMYKVEPVVADGGEVVIYAPQLDEVSYTHGELIEEIGYHCRDYFLAQWDRFKDYPGGILAHSTHLKGLGRYDAATGETARVQVTLATAISEERCRRLNLRYLDPARVDVLAWREREDTLVVPRAGEMLYRVKPAAAARDEPKADAVPSAV
jgi:nickel-dependent lactate racemase